MLYHFTDDNWTLRTIISVYYVDVIPSARSISEDPMDIDKYKFKLTIRTYITVLNKEQIFIGI